MRSMGELLRMFLKSPSLVYNREKNKLVSGEELGDGVRRQGRTGRGLASTRSVNPMGVMKHGTAKQLRSARNSSDKGERAGRPPTRKLSDSKAYKRHKNTATNATILDFLDDGHEELQAAVNLAINFAQNFPSSFWKHMERYFCFISDAHINFVKQQGELSSMGATPGGTSSQITRNLQVAKWILKLGPFIRDYYQL